MMNKRKLDENDKVIWGVAIVFFLVLIISSTLYYKTTYIEEIIGFLLLGANLFYYVMFPHYEKREFKFKFFIGAFCLSVVSLLILFLLDMINNRILFPAAIAPLIFFLTSIGLKAIFRNFLKNRTIFYQEEDSEDVKERKEMVLASFPLISTMFIVFL